MYRKHFFDIVTLTGLIFKSLVKRKNYYLSEKLVCTKKQQT
jgi:hypothetical protein